MLGERLGKRFATLHGVQHLAHDALQLGIVREFRERGETAIERQARRGERRQLLREHQEVAMADALTAEAAELRERQTGRPQPGSVTGGADVERNQTAVVQTRDDCGYLRGLDLGPKSVQQVFDRSFDDLALRINRAVLELRQSISPPRTPIPSHPPLVDG